MQLELEFQTPLVRQLSDDGNIATMHADTNGVLDHLHCHISGLHTQDVPYLRSEHVSDSFYLFRV